jgi:GT2 family glycosyltransferase/glycosyltransferase involved in cell wall biosynthesis
LGLQVRRFRIDTKPVRPPARPPLEVDVSKVARMARDAWTRGEALARAGDLQGGLAWLGRAHRIAPRDANIRFALAWLQLRAGQAEAAAALFGPMAETFATRECFCGLIAACIALGRIEEAAACAQTALSRTAADPALTVLATQIAARGRGMGWCGMDEDGALLIGCGDVLPKATLNGAALVLEPLGAGRFRLPAPARAGQLAVSADGENLLGSPIALDRLWRLDGFAERDQELVSGFAWHPGAPGVDPTLVVTDEAGNLLQRLTATKPLGQVDGDVPLARPRGFTSTVPAGLAVHVRGPDGRDVLGSPLPAAVPTIPKPRRARPAACPGLAVDVIIPVYRGLDATLACLRSAVETVAPPNRIVVVDDASPEPELVAALDDLQAAGAIHLIRPLAGAGNRGFPASVNAGMRAAAGRHVILLNSDTLVASGWLEALRDAACSAPDIGTATPISNEASILSYPGEAGTNPAPDMAGTRDLAALAARANRGRLVEIPTAHGFCMFIRRDCLDQTGLFEETLFAQGYGEENDFCERARGLGWRHVAVPEVFVAHLGGMSFGGARMALLARNLRLLEQRHPGYAARVDEWIAADTLAPARRRLDIARFEAAGPKAGHSVLIVTHGAGGGTSRVVAERSASLRAAGHRPVILRAMDGMCELGDGELATPNLRFTLPAELTSLVSLLRQTRPVAAEIHHLLGHDRSIMRVCEALGIPYDIWVHDYAWFCARISFVTGEGRFCGEADTASCETCLRRWGWEIEEIIDPAELRRRSLMDFRHARAVIVPSEDVARRVLRHAPGARIDIKPWEDAPPLSASPPPRARDVTRIAVIGAIGVDKGFDVLLACGRDAAARRLALEFVVVGYTCDDEALLDTGRVFITGEFARAEAAALIRAQDADLAFLPSIWPETWCYALSDAWAGGVSTVVFDIGTPPARIRAAGRGWVLPLGLPAPQVNDMLIALSKLDAANALLAAG